MHPPQKRRQQQLLWPGLQKRGRLAALGRAAGSGGNMLPLQSDPSLLRSSAPGDPSCSIKADSCPTSLLAAAGRLQVQAEGSTELAMQTGGGGAAATEAAGAAVGQGEAAGATARPAAPAAAAGQLADSNQTVDRAAGQESSLLGLSQQQQEQQALPCEQQPLELPHQQQEDQQQQQPDAQDVLLSPRAPVAQPTQQQQQHQTLPWKRGAGARSLPSSSSHSVPGPSATAGAAAAVTTTRGGVTGPPSGSNRQQSSTAGAAASAAGGAAAAGGTHGAGRSLLVDQRRPVRALVGVRMVWVLPEQRRKGVATKLLDAAR